VATAILKLDRDRNLLNADITWTYPVDPKSVEPVQKHLNKCQQRIIPEQKRNYLVKCSNGGPPAIWIISLYLWYQVYFVIIIVECLVTVLSTTYLRDIFWGWTIPLNKANYLLKNVVPYWHWRCANHLYVTVCDCV